MKIFKAEQWNLDLLLPLFEQYRTSQGMDANPERTRHFLANRIRFSESILFIATEQEQAIGFVQLYPRLSSLALQRYWQLTDIFVLPIKQDHKIYNALIEKAKEFVSFTQSRQLIVEQELPFANLWQQEGFKHNKRKAVFEFDF